MTEPPRKRSAAPAAPGARRGLALAVGVALAGACVALGLDPRGGRAAIAQDWPPFVLVAGLLLIGLVADADGLFAAAGHRLARLAPNGTALYVGAVVLVAGVSAVLNLDTAVAFLTPVLVHTARSRDEDDAPLLYGALLLANAASILLPGSNLTNLIVLHATPVTGGAFAAKMAPAFLAAVVVTAAVVGLAERRALATRTGPVREPDRPVLGIGLAAIGAATVLVLFLADPAPAVGLVGVAAAGARVARRAIAWRRVLAVLGLPILLGLFSIAVGLGTLARSWSGPATLLAHLGTWATAGLAALAAICLNNLPAASLLAAHVPPHPFALLLGLNLGPNLLPTGSLAWILWYRTARAAGAHPSLRRASALGGVAVPLALAAATAALGITGAH